MLQAAALLITTVIICNASDENSSDGANSEVLAESLRRQLMKDNYDYTSSETKESKSDEITRNQMFISVKNDNTEKKREDPSKHRLKHDIKRNVKPKISATVEIMNDENNLDHSKMQSIGDDPKVLVQGNNRKQIQRRKKKITPESKNRDSIRSRKTDKISYEEDTFSYDSYHTTTVQYKILKVKPDYRRSGKQVLLIQEEAPEGVAIVNLGNGAIPTFRLPHTRRQYMHDPLDIGAFGDDDELPPPPVNETFTPEESTQTINSDIPTTTHVAEHSSDNVHMSSLRSTVTHDEIFVF